MGGINVVQGWPYAHALKEEKEANQTAYTQYTTIIIVLELLYINSMALNPPSNEMEKFSCCVYTHIFVMCTYCVCMFATMGNKYNTLEFSVTMMTRDTVATAATVTATNCHCHQSFDFWVYGIDFIRVVLILIYGCFQ